MTISCIYQGHRKTYTFDCDEIVIGRGSASGGADLKLDPDLRVSRRHARMFVDGGQCFIEDLGSRGGVSVNHAKIVAPWELHAGDVVKIGDTMIALEQEISPMLDEDGEIIATLDGSSPKRKIEPEPEAEVTEFFRKEDMDEANIGEGGRVVARLNGWESRMFTADTGDAELNERLGLLYELPLQFAVEEEPDTLWKLILNRSLELIPGAERGSLLDYDPATDTLEMRYCIPEDEEPPVDRSLIREVAGKGMAAVWSRDTDDAESSHSGIYAPLIRNEAVIGILYVDSPAIESAFSDDEMNLLQTVAHYAGAVLGLRRW